MQTHIVTTYSFTELDERAKERARDWYRIGALEYDWWEYVYEDAERIGLKITGFDLGRAQSITGELQKGVHEVVQSIIAEHGSSCGTYKFAQAYYSRKHSGWPMDEEEFTQQLLEEYRVILDHEYEYLLSDECIDESLEANDYQFTEQGEFWS